MPSFFLALMAAALATAGGRDAVRVARLAAALGGRGPLLVACWLACTLACFLAARLGAGISQQLVPAAKDLLVAAALLLAALELAILRAGNAPAEPTRSFGAIMLVLGASQLTAASGFLVFALSAAAGAPGLSGLGGAVGSGAVLTLACLAACEWEARLPLGLLRYSASAALVVTALFTGLSAQGLLR